jgi:hypothetical protein
LLIEKALIRLDAAEWPDIDATKPLTVLLDRADNSVWFCGFTSDNVDISYRIGDVEITGDSRWFHEKAHVKPRNPQLFRFLGSFPIEDDDYLEIIFDIQNLHAITKAVRRKTNHHVGVQLTFDVGYALALCPPDEKAVLLNLHAFEVRTSSSVTLKRGDFFEMVIGVKDLRSLTKELKRAPKTKKFVGLKKVGATVETLLYENAIDAPVPLADPLPTSTAVH